MATVLALPAELTIYTAADLAAQASMRRAFDPSGLANPFKVLPSPHF